MFNLLTGHRVVVCSRFFKFKPRTQGVTRVFTGNSPSTVKTRELRGRYIYCGDILGLRLCFWKGFSTSLSVLSLVLSKLGVQSESSFHRSKCLLISLGLSPICLASSGMSIIYHLENKFGSTVVGVSTRCDYGEPFLCVYDFGPSIIVLGRREEGWVRPLQKTSRVWVPLSLLYFYSNFDLLKKLKGT